MDFDTWLQFKHWTIDTCLVHYDNSATKVIRKLQKQRYTFYKCQQLKTNHLHQTVFFQIIIKLLYNCPHSNTNTVVITLDHAFIGLKVS